MALKLIHIRGIGQSTIPMKSKDKLTKRENYSNVLEVKKLDKPEDWAREFDKLPGDASQHCLALTQVEE